MAASLVYSCQLRYNLLSINKSVMRLLHINNLSEVNAYVHFTNAVLSPSSYAVMFILLTGIRYWCDIILIFNPHRRTRLTLRSSIHSLRIRMT